MRIVAVADTHLFQADLRQMPEGDLFIHAGDLLRGGSLDELRAVSPWLHALPFAHKIVIAGNHDWCCARELDQALTILGPDITYLQDTGVTIGGVRIWGSPWQPEYNDWAFNLPRGEPLAQKWELIPKGIDLLITHGPPQGIGDRMGMSQREGCEELLAAVRRIRPALHVFGHIHQDGGFWRDGDTCFANVTTCESVRGPTVIDLDCGARQVIEVGVPPARRVRNHPR